MTVSRRTPLWTISACADSMVGSATAVTRLAGPPARVIASWIRRTFAIEHSRAFGCTLKTMLLPAATMAMVLQMMVEVGLVVGTMPAITPEGVATLRAAGLRVTVEDSADRVLPIAGYADAGAEIGEALVKSVLDAAKGDPTRLLAGRTVVVTAGPTREAIDPVRYLSNRSSGKMGYALAAAAARPPAGAAWS